MCLLSAPQGRVADITPSSSATGGAANSDVEELQASNAEEAKDGGTCIGAFIYDEETNTMLGVGAQRVFVGVSEVADGVLAYSYEYSYEFSYAVAMMNSPGDVGDVGAYDGSDEPPSADGAFVPAHEGPEMSEERQETFNNLVVLSMQLRAPLSAKLSIVWMLLIASIGPLVRERISAKKKLAAQPKGTAWKEKTEYYKKLASFVIASTASFTFVPIVLVATLFVLAVMLAAVILAIWQIQLIGIWVSLILVLLFKEPATKLYQKLGIEDKDVDYSGLENRGTRFLIWMSEGPVFKYYFGLHRSRTHSLPALPTRRLTVTASTLVRAVGGLQVAGVILQFFALSQAFAKVEYEAGSDRFEEFLAPHGGLTGRLYHDFFMLSTYRPDYAFGAVDFIFNWRLPKIGTPDLPTDVFMSMISQLTYIVGLIFLLVEGVLGIIIEMSESVSDAL